VPPNYLEHSNVCSFVSGGKENFSSQLASCLRSFFSQTRLNRIFQWSDKTKKGGRIISRLNVKIVQIL